MIDAMNETQIREVLKREIDKLPEPDQLFIFNTIQQGYSKADNKLTYLRGVLFSVELRRMHLLTTGSKEAKL